MIRWLQHEHAGGCWALLTAQVCVGSLCDGSSALSDWLCTHTEGKETAFRPCGWSCVVLSDICALYPRRSCHTRGKRRQRRPQCSCWCLLWPPQRSSHHCLRQQARPPPQVAPPATHQARVNVCSKSSTQLVMGGKGQGQKGDRAQTITTTRPWTKPPSKQKHLQY